MYGIFFQLQDIFVYIAVKPILCLGIPYDVYVLELYLYKFG